MNELAFTCMSVLLNLCHGTVQCSAVQCTISCSPPPSFSWPKFCSNEGPNVWNIRLKQLIYLLSSSRYSTIKCFTCPVIQHNSFFRNLSLPPSHMLAFPRFSLARLILLTYRHLPVPPTQCLQVLFLVIKFTHGSSTSHLRSTPVVQ